MDKDKKHRVTLTEQDLSTLAHILRQFTDYMAFDDRPDHGLNNLYGYRDLPQERKSEIYWLCGKINHAWRKTWKSQ
jgi:hypothetical protein